MYSFTEENYIKAIYKLQELHKGSISTNAIALVMQTKAASVTDMVKKLAEKKLLVYEKYRGVSLTNSGNKVAVETVRKHRLWETFLNKKLGFSWDEVHDIAEQLEHIQSNKLVDKLDEFLGYPTHDPHGDPIPARNGAISRTALLPASDMKLGGRGIISGVINHSSLFLQHLEKNNLVLGMLIEVLGRSEFDQSVKIRLAKSEVIISHEVARNLLIKVD